MCVYFLEHLNSWQNKHSPFSFNQNIPRFFVLLMMILQKPQQALRMARAYWREVVTSAVLHLPRCRCCTWRMGPTGLVSSLGLASIYKPSSSAIFGRGPTTPGNLRSPWLLTTYKSWDDPPKYEGFRIILYCKTIGDRKNPCDWCI